MRCSRALAEARRAWKAAAKEGGSEGRRPRREAAAKGGGGEGRRGCTVVAVERVQQLRDKLVRGDEVEATHGGDQIAQVEVLHAAPVELVERAPDAHRVPRVLRDFVLQRALQLAHGDDLQPRQLLRRRLEGLRAGRMKKVRE
jgi:hypothetical protein